MSRGLFISFEGRDGSGKSSLTRALARALPDALGRPVMALRAPGAGALGQALRPLMLRPPLAAYNRHVWYSLFALDFQDALSTTIRPAVGRGDLVLVDRWDESFMVYGEIQHQFATEWLAECLEQRGVVPPDHHFLPLVSSAEAQRRRPKDREIAEKAALYEEVQKRFLEIAKQFPGTWTVLPEDSSFEEMFRMCSEKIAKLWEGRIK